MVNSELSGDPADPQHSDARLRRSLDELLPHVERYGLELNLEAHPYDFIELNDAAVDLVRGINSHMSTTFFAPRTPSTSLAVRETCGGWSSTPATV